MADDQRQAGQRSVLEQVVPADADVWVPRLVLLAQAIVIGVVGLVAALVWNGTMFDVGPSHKYRVLLAVANIKGEYPIMLAVALFFAAAGASKRASRFASWVLLQIGVCGAALCMMALVALEETLRLATARPASEPTVIPTVSINQSRGMATLVYLPPALVAGIITYLAWRAWDESVSELGAGRSSSDVENPPVAESTA